MGQRLKEIGEELKSVLSGKTLDAVLAPAVFVFVNLFAELIIAIGSAVLVALILVILRLLTRKTWHYAFGGLAGVLVASGFAYLAGSAVNYFIPGLVVSAFLLLIAITSIIIRKPLAAWASHLTRGWKLEWFWRKDVLPAYREVTWLWAVFLLVRLVIQTTLFLAEDIVQLFWVSTLLGLPVTIVVLIISYVYGIWRLRRLGGPGIEEFIQGKEPPWKGQTRGF